MLRKLTEQRFRWLMLLLLAHLVSQDLSVAGKRAGMRSELNGDTETTRSGLFFDALRIIKEMRAESERQLRSSGADYDRRMVRPRFSVYENVCGAFSSNNGEDWRIVLEETARIADETAVIPKPPKGKWSLAGCIVGDGWSLAWRTTDNQFWGTPQRRRRIALVADFGGERAAEILFEREGVSGNTEPSEQEGQETTRTVGKDLTETGGGCANNGRNRADDSEERNTTSFTLKVRGGAEFDRYGKRAGKGALIQEELSGTLGVSQDQTLITLEGNGSRDSHRGDGYRESNIMYTLNTVEQHSVCYGISPYDSNAMKSSNPHSGIYKADTSRTLDLNGGSPACNQGGMAIVQGINGDIAGTLDANYYKGCGEREGTEREVVCIGNGQVAQAAMSNQVGALNCMHDQQAVMVYGLDRASFNQGQNAQYDFAVEEELAPTVLAKGPGGGISPTVGALCARDYKGVGNQYVDEGKCIIDHL